MLLRGHGHRRYQQYKRYAHEWGKQYHKDIWVKQHGSADCELC